MKIATKLNLSFLLLLFLPLILSIGFSIVYYTQKIEEEAQAKLQADLQVAQLMLDVEIRKLRDLAVAYSHKKVLSALLSFNLRQKIEAELAQIAQQNQLDLSVFIDLSYTTIPHIPPTLYRNHALADHVQSGLERVDEHIAIFAVSPAYNRTGDIIGMFLLRRSLHNFETISRHIDVNAIITSIESHTASSDQADQAIHSQEEYLSASTVLHDFRNNPLGVLVIQHSSDNFKGTRSTALQVFAIISAVGIGLAVLLKISINRNIMKPIFQLCQATKQIKSGNFTIAAIIKNQDEIGDLTESFCGMVNSLQENFRQYQKLLNQAAHGIAVIQQGKFVFINVALLKMLGKKREDLLDAPIEAIFKTGYIPEEWEIRKGQWFDCHYDNIIWRTHVAELLTVQDITTQKIGQIEVERERQYLQSENIRLRNLVEERHSFGKMIGKSLPMQKIYEQIPSVAASDATVLLQGETGTGKGLLARTIHQHSPRQPHPFIMVNCGSIPETLIEREFFGHVRGAFTGADRDKPGCLDAAQGGTLFLDEIGELPPAMQVKLLHVLDGDGFSTIGSSLKIYPDIRIITATNQNLERLVEQKKVREDFYYRINVIPVKILPLRKRKEDILLLINHFWHHSENQDGNGAEAHFPQRLQEDFLKHTWPGNVRELENTIQRLQTLKTSPFDKNFKKLHTMLGDSKLSHSTLQENLEAYERFLIEMTLSQADGHREQAATLLGITARTLYRKLKKFKIST